MDSIELDRDVCMALLGCVPVGRLVHSERAMPAVTPVNFVLLSDGVYVRTRDGSRIHQLAEQAGVVAFEADAYDAVGQHGWSVVVLGRLEVITDPLVLARVEAASLLPWAGGERAILVRVPVEMVTGRRVGRPLRVPTA